MLRQVRNRILVFLQVMMCLFKMEKQLEFKEVKKEQKVKKKNRKQIKYSSFILKLKETNIENLKSE